MSPDWPLETERLTLRPLRAADAEAMHRIYSDPVVMRYVATGPAARGSVK